MKESTDDDINLYETVENTNNENPDQTEGDLYNVYENVEQCSHHREPDSYVSLKISNSDRCNGRCKNTRWKFLALLGLVSSIVLACVTVYTLLIAEHRKQCDENICFPDQCENGGSCYVSGNLSVCVCTVGYRGHTCNVSVCSSFPCKHGGALQGGDRWF